MLELSDYLGPHEGATEEVRSNALVLLSRVATLLRDIPLPEARDPKINSGWRPQAYNAKVPNAAPNSKHITGQAVDLADPDGVLDSYLHTHFDLLIKHRLWMEHPSATKGWCHLQSVPPRSGNLCFYP